MKRMQRLQPMQRLSVESAVRGDMPPIPKLPIDAFFLDAGDLEIVEDRGTLLEQSGLRSGSMKGKGSSSAAAFFGVQDSGWRIVIVVNSSAGMCEKPVIKAYRSTRYIMKCIAHR